MIDSKPQDFEDLSLSASQFPYACCDDTSLILAAYLSDNGFAGSRVIRGKHGGKNRELKSHVWLSLDSIEIDITADQFNNDDYNNPSVILEAGSKFLSSFNSIEDGEADFRQYVLKYSSPELMASFQHCYEVIIKKLNT